MPVTPGTHVDLAIPNVVVRANSPDGSWMLVEFPAGKDGQKPQIWVPTDERVTVTPIAPANWPPQAGDIWEVPGVTPQAWVVDDGTGKLYFVMAQNVLDAYSGHPDQPVTVEDALAQFGTTLKLDYRKPAA